MRSCDITISTFFRQILPKDPNKQYSCYDRHPNYLIRVRILLIKLMRLKEPVMSKKLFLTLYCRA